MSVRLPSPAAIIACLALAVAATPPAWSAARSLGADSVGSRQVKDHSLRAVDLRPGAVARPRQNSWTYDVGGSEELSPSWTTSFGYLATDGTGPLKLTKPSLVQVNGRLTLTSGTYGSVTAAVCDVLVDGVALQPSIRAITERYVVVPVTGQLVADPGTHVVSLQCNQDGGSATARIGDVQVNVLAYPR